MQDHKDNTHNPNYSSTTIDPGPIMGMASAFYASNVLFSASDLGVFSFLSANGPSDGETIVDRCRLDPRGGRLLLDACVAVGLLHKESDLYSNTPQSEAFLVPGKPGDLSKAIRYNRDVYNAWGKLSDLVRTGTPVEAPSLHLGDDAARTRTFVMSMYGRAMGIGQGVVPLLDLTKHRQILDIGGGPAAYAILMCRANPELHCTVMDLPPIVEIASELVARHHLTDRITLLPGDYHQAAFPENIDAITIFGVLHQESPDAIADILKRAYKALKPGGEIIVLDMMTDDTRTHPPFSALFAVNMALTTDNGWVFSSDDLEGWLTKSGFEGFTCRPLPPPMPHWLVTAQKVEA